MNQVNRNCDRETLSPLTEFSRDARGACQRSIANITKRQEVLVDIEKLKQVKLSSKLWYSKN